MRQLISIGDLSIDRWQSLYKTCCDIMDRPADYVDACRGRVMASLFYEPSTRTSFSFQAAMTRLGGSVFGFSNALETSVSKGETFADTIRICSAYADTIVIRSPQEGAAMAASLYSPIPVINAGDGGHMHPTQTLADLTTISRLRGGIDDLSIGICGDLKYGRTTHSLVEALMKFRNIRYYLISPQKLSMPDYMISAMKTAGQKFIIVKDLEEALPQLDVLYMTRIQKERFVDPHEYDRNKGIYILTPKKLERAKKELLIMHPLPRVDEIQPDVDNDSRAVYFEQARYGMFIRMALLLRLCHLPRLAPALPEGKTGIGCANPQCITIKEHYLPSLSKKTETGEYCAYCDTEKGKP